MQNDLKFSGVTPVIINYNGSEDDIYAPLRTSSSDINIVSPSILDDLYTARKDEIIMKIEKGTPVRTYVVDCTDSGLIESLEYTPTPEPNENYTIISKDLFFTDINGDYRFMGTLEDAGGNQEFVNMIYNTSLELFEDDNYWKLQEGMEYFTDGVKSYATSYDGSIHHIYDWNSTTDNWGNDGSYQMVTSGGTTVDCNKSVVDIFTYIDGSFEMLTDKDRYTWDDANRKWVYSSSYADCEGNNFTDISGKWHMRMFDKRSKMIDVCMITGYDAGDSEIESNWIVELDKVSSTFICLIPLPGSIQNEVFTNGNGGVFYVDPVGKVYSWSWGAESWIEWLVFEDENAVANSYHLDYVAPEKVYISYQTADGKKAFCLKNIVPPKAIKRVVVSPDIPFTTIWEGYKMPNSYSQPVTQNLDSISMTMIDPLSILKYVTVDKLFTNNTIYTFKDLINYTLGYIYIDSNKLKVERNVSYGGAFDYDSHNGLLDMQINMSNFWDEGGEPSTIYDMLSELLRPFCMTLVFDGEQFIIYNPNRTGGTRVFDEFDILRYGTFDNHNVSAESTVVFDFNSGDWKSQNTQDAQIEINSTYDEVTGVASTKKPEYSNMADDLVDYNQRDKYDYIDLNVQRNKTKGYLQRGGGVPTIDTNDYWYYIWNGAYVNEDFGLESHNNLVNGYLNINKAYEYLTGLTGDPTDYGSILNFYGGGDNPQGTGKTQEQEKPVEIKKGITAYAPDNGNPLEFLELSDLDWNWSGVVDPETGYGTYSLTKVNSSSSVYGTSIAMQDSDKITYHQEYEMYLNPLVEHTIDITLSQAYSRTGINTNIDIYQNNTSTNGVFDLSWDDDNQIWVAFFSSASADYFPDCWDATSVKVDTVYFNRYNTTSTLFRPIRLQPVWDKRRVNMYIELTGGGVLQYNGKDWVSSQAVDNNNSFYLMKMMNGEKLYHTDFRYNIIETSDGEHYSLTDERFTYYTDEAGGVTTGSVSGGSSHNFEVYKSEGNAWYQWVNGCDEGSLSIKMPDTADVNATIVVDVYNSTMLGMTGRTNNSNGYFPEDVLYYKVEGQGKYWDEDTQQYVYITLSPSNCKNYGVIGNASTPIGFIPYNVSYVKAEHIDLNISVNVPESNLGQMFSESDIKYKIVKDRQMIEKFDDLTFNVNTYNQLVNNSFSYIIYEDNFANPDEFIINNVNARPEIYTTQAYMNWLSVVRKVYKKVLKPIITDFKFTNIRTFIKSPEVGTNKMMVVADSVDLKTNRHSVTAVECQDIDVSTIDQYNAIEIPRRARNDRWNLPTAYKK